MQRNLMIGAALFILAGAAVADEPEARQLYGSGVHSYFAGDYKEAYDALSGAVDLSSSDPRVYYFRGLALWQLGRTEKAKEDFVKAADLEVRAVDDPAVSVNRALERVQGKARLEIEKYRLTARKERRKKQISEDAARFNRIGENEPNILEGFPPKQTPKSQEKAPESKGKKEPMDGDDEKPAEPTAKAGGKFNPFKEAGLPKLKPRKPAADDPEPNVADNPPGKKPAEPKAGGQKKSGTLALLKALGKVVESNMPDVSEIPKAMVPGAKAPPAPKKPAPPKQDE